MKNIKVGLIGFGFMGTTHWDIYEGLKGVEVTALAAQTAAEFVKIQGFQMTQPSC